MNEGADKYSRLISLRAPARLPASAAQLSRSGDRLCELLGGEYRETSLGRHLVVRGRIPQPPLCVTEERALRLLLPGSTPDEADPQRWVLLDTETTGLAGGTGTYAFLIGVAWWEGPELAVEQFFMQDHSQEASMLIGLAERLGGRRVIITFNGKSFDCPLLETRFRMTRLGTFPVPAFHLDLLYPARTLYRLRLTSVALGELERHVLALDRGTDIPSETIPGRYFSFLRGGPPEPLAEVFEHNVKDLRGLASLAVHIAGLLESGERSGLDGLELLGIAHLLRLRGERDLAGARYARALAQGLPETAERAARRQLALLSRRRRDFESASSHWKRLLDESREGLEAYEQLAIYYEHHEGDFRHALAVTHEALVRLQGAHQSGRISPQQYRRLHSAFHHRLSRLAQKTRDR